MGRRFNGPIQEVTTEQKPLNNQIKTVHRRTSLDFIFLTPKCTFIARIEKGKCF